jgi:hypothetical protein
LRVDDRDLSKVSVWSEEDKFLCVACSNRKLPADANRELLREAMADKRRASKMLRGVREARLKIAEDLPDLMRAAAAARNQVGQSVTPPPPPQGLTSIPIRSAMERELESVRNAQKIPLRKAVGDDTAAAGSFQYASQNREADGTDAPAGFVYHGRRDEGADRDE